MKKLLPILFISLFTSSSFADSIYLKNGQKVHGQLVRVTATEAVVVSGDYESSYDIFQINRVEDESGVLLFKDGRVLVSDLSSYAVTVSGSSLESSFSRNDNGASKAVGRGSYMIGGGISFTSMGGDLYGEGEGDRLSTLVIAPQMTYFVGSNIGLGLDVTTTFMSQGDYSTSEVTLGPRLMFVVPTRSLVRPYLGIGAGIIRYGYGGGYSQSDILLTAKGSFGLLFFLNEHIATNMELTYKWDRYNPESSYSGDSVTGNSVLFSVGFSGFIH